MRGPTPADIDSMSANVLGSVIVGDNTLVDLDPFVNIAPHEFPCEPLRDNHVVNCSVLDELLPADLLPGKPIVRSDVNTLALSALHTSKVNEGEVMPFLGRA